jgi:glycerophosphoryl diester phosphodiesterase
MIDIIAHRGYWLEPNEKNTLASFRRAMDSGFGIETDFRDYHGDLVVEHDLSSKDSISAGKFFDVCRGTTLPLALNVKSDGLQTLISDYTSQGGVNNYFCFDASIPDSLGYLKHRIPFYARMSEFENWNERLYCQVNGIWLDQFVNNWFDERFLLELLGKVNNICMVSPELHKRPHLSLWELVRRIMRNGTDLQKKVSICSDFPKEAELFFKDV